MTLSETSQTRPTSQSDVYYDPFDFGIDNDPYPVWKRLREEAPLYWNEKYRFFALSRYGDVALALPDWRTYRSGRGTIPEVIFSGIQIPPGIILFEDPPIHDLHRPSRTWSLPRQACSARSTCPSPFRPEPFCFEGRVTARGRDADSTRGDRRMRRQ